MGLETILWFSLAALALRWLCSPRWIGVGILLLSLVGIYGLQSSSPVRGLDFWLPTLSILLTVLTWTVVRRQAREEAAPVRFDREMVIAVILLAGLPLLLAFTGRFEALCCLTASPPPPLISVMPGIGLAAGLALVTDRFRPRFSALPGILIGLLVALLVIWKTPLLAIEAAAGLRRLNGQNPELAVALDLPWIGFSYMAFRLIHTLRDHQNGRLPALDLPQFVGYALFFPALTAGPIDRTQNWISDLLRARRQPTGLSTIQNLLHPTAPSGPRASSTPLITDTLHGVQRIGWGIFMKFAVADALALFALSPQSAVQITSTGWAWALLLAYSLRIYFDFAGYTHIAIGLGRLMGFHLPENFDRPYLKTNLTSFWNSWHITLAQWFRAYYFYPFTRWLRTRPTPPPVWVAALITQLTTMALIGLWHGVTANFLIWGVWHGVGLFIHGRYSEWIRPYLTTIEARPALRRLIAASSWLITFLYVSLGWVWFALPDPAQAAALFQLLFGL